LRLDESTILDWQVRLIARRIDIFPKKSQRKERKGKERKGQAFF
jgi:hypothetical protein